MLSEQQCREELNDRERQAVADLDAYVDRVLVDLRPSSAGVVVTRWGELLHERYSQGRDLPVGYPAIDAASLWPAWSVTKSYVAGLLLHLAYQGVLRLDDPVARYLPVFETPGGGPFSRCDVTIRHLASHSSGLVWDEGDDAFNGDSVAVEQLRAATKPGEVLHYSAIGMHVLEKTVEAATGEDLERLIVDRILTPLELHETRYVYRYSKTLPLLPSHVEGPVVRQDDYKFMQRGDRASAGLYMTARDLNRWCRLWLHSGTLDGHTLFSPELQREAWTFHSLRQSDQGRSGLLWWLYEDDGAYMTSGLSRTLSVVYPRTGIVLTVARNQIGPFVGAFDYAVDKKRLVALANRFGPD